MRLVLATPALAALAFVGLVTASCALTPKVSPQLAIPGGAPTAVPGTDVTLLLTEVEDQRCPAGVDCVWAGMIRVELTVSTPTSKQEIILCNQCDNARDLATAGGLTIGLVGLAPSTEELAKLGREPVLDDYELTVNYAPAE
ncbi:MAG: hypothetical protein EON48_16260 [Acetobacteraceae bacterium]|nr:MAG: hypothetical protein EON48_16260 [Acetobacteraceae bacterium]